MNDAQVMGLVILAIGAYLFFCAIWFQEFFLYRAQVARVVDLFGSTFAHEMYASLGFLMVLFGGSKALGLF